jgi:hypothetical protein
MARHLLTARQVQAAGEGDHSDADGLYLRVKVDGKSTGTTASWVFAAGYADRRGHRD